MKKTIFLSLIPVLLFFAVPFSGQQKAVEIKTKTNFVHSKSKITFPTSWNGFARQKLVSYDSDQSDVGASYSLKEDKKVTFISIYVYPADVSNENLRDQFLSFQVAADQNSTNHPVLKPGFIKLSSSKVTVNGIYSVFPYDLMVADFMKGQKEQKNKSLLSIYDCGKWNLKFRITSESYDEDRLKSTEKLLTNSFSPIKLAEENILDSAKSPNILLSKNVTRDSMFAKASIAEADAKIRWMDQHKPAQELKTGFSDFEIEAHEFAISEKLDFYRYHKGKTGESEETKTYFENLQKIADGGFLKDFIYAQTFGVVNYPEGESRKNLFETFKKENHIPDEIIELFYKIYY